MNFCENKFVIPSQLVENIVLQNEFILLRKIISSFAHLLLSAIILFVNMVSFPDLNVRVNTIANVFVDKTH